MSEPVRKPDDGSGMENGGEHRVAPRYTLLIRTAKLISASGEYPLRHSRCVIHRGQHSHFPCLAAGRTADARTAQWRSAPIERVWEKEGSAGFRFPVSVDIDRLLNNQGRFPKRRCGSSCNCRHWFPATGAPPGVVIHNISQQGAQIESPLLSRARPETAARGGQSARASRRGCAGASGTQYGLVFDDTFQFSELAKLAAQLQGSCNVECGSWGYVAVDAALPSDALTGR